MLQLLAVDTTPASREALESVASLCGTKRDWPLQVAEALEDHFPRMLIHTGECPEIRGAQCVSVHAPAQDRATGPLGHLGVCLGRIICAEAAAHGTSGGRKMGESERRR